MCWLCRVCCLPLAMQKMIFRQFSTAMPPSMISPFNMGASWRLTCKCCKPPETGLAALLPRRIRKMVRCRCTKPVWWLWGVVRQTRTPIPMCRKLPACCGKAWGLAGPRSAIQALHSRLLNPVLNMWQSLDTAVLCCSRIFCFPAY